MQFHIMEAEARYPLHCRAECSSSARLQTTLHAVIAASCLTRELY